MITIKDEFLTCTKLKRAIRAGGYEVLATWLAMKAYADRRGDGFIADEMFNDLPGQPSSSRKCLRVLIECGDVSRGTDGGLSRGHGLVDEVPGGFELHDYGDHAASREEVEERKRKARVKKARQRARLRELQKTRESESTEGTIGDTSGDIRGDIRGDTNGDIRVDVPGSTRAREPSSPLPSSPQGSLRDGSSASQAPLELTPAVESEKPNSKPVPCPINFLPSDSQAKALATKHGVTLERVRASVPEFVWYWTDGKGAGKRRSLRGWAQSFGRRIDDEARSGSLYAAPRRTRNPESRDDENSALADNFVQ